MVSRQREESVASALGPWLAHRRARTAGVLVLAGLLAGCDPILNIQGAFFPAWILCLAAGLVVTGIAHRLLVVSELQAHVGPLPLVYPSIALLSTNLFWLAFFRT